MKLAVLLSFVVVGLAMVWACTPKAVDCRVEFLKMADAGKDAP